MALPLPQYSLNPGPLIPDVLFLHKEHRAAALFEGRINDCQLKVRRCDANFWKEVDNIPECVMCHVREAGFEGVIRCGRIQLDHALITALVERWRPETHTFHFPIGEATVTLQDVEVLWGLNIEGAAVIATEWNASLNEWIETCELYLGFTPPEGAIHHNRIQLSCLYDVIRIPLSNDASERTCIQRARVYILYLLGGLLLSDSSGSSVYLHHLTFFTDMFNSSIMSWGSAVLACLYRRLCKAASYTATEICGPLVLLQLWAWERLPTIRPIRRNLEIDFTRPYGSRWNGEFHISRVPTHVLPAYRDQLTSLRSDQFIWLPYSDDVLNLLPSYCTHGRDIWRSVTYLLCWEIVEPHQPNRVMRQFGMYQPIPVSGLLDAKLHKKLHALVRTGRFNNDWTKAHSSFDDHWVAREHYVQNGNIVDDITNVSTEYMTWYWERTVIYITRPSSSNKFQEGFQGDGFTTELLMDGMIQAFNMSLRLMTISDAKHAGYFAQMRDLLGYYMHAAGDKHRLKIQSSHVFQGVRHQNVNPPHEIEREINVQKRRQGGRRRRIQATEGQQFDTRHVPDTDVGESSSHAAQYSYFACATSKMHTPPLIATTTSTPFPLSPVQSHTQLVITPTHYLQFNRVVSSDTGECSDPSIEKHVHVDEDIPLAQRRPRRAIKHTICGTHGKLGGH